VRADRVLGFEDDHLAPGLGQGAGNGETDDPAADYDGVKLFHATEAIPG